MVRTTQYFLFDQHSFGTQSQTGLDGPAPPIGLTCHQLIAIATLHLRIIPKKVYIHAKTNNQNQYDACVL